MQALFLKHDAGPRFKGDLTEVRASGSPFTGLDPNDFVMVEVDTPMAAYEQYTRNWPRLIDFDVINQNLALDGFRLRLFSTNVNGVLGAVTRADVEAFISNWGGVVHSVAANEVVFDILIFDALTSLGFWGRSYEQADISNMQFTEVAYDQGTGIHRIELDYSLTGRAPSEAERYVERKGLPVVSHVESALTYDADRSVVRTAFQNDIRNKSQRVVAKQRYHVSGAVVDYIVGQGGMITTDVATLAGYIQDKMVD